MIYHRDALATLYLGDCLEVLRTLPAESIDACVTDPPYGIGFMDQPWDTFAGGRVFSNVAFQTWSANWATEVLRVLKPGAHAIVCAAPRLYHRMAVGVEDAGFEIRDSVAWLYGSGFPKSLNLGDGLGTALKPAHEPIVLARKPLRGTVAANVAAYGTGALNIDGSRIDGDLEEMRGRSGGGGVATGFLGYVRRKHGQTFKPNDLGRWPANVALDDLAALVLDEQSGGYGEADTGGASRFFYCAKPSQAERDMGCGQRRNGHPTVKPIALMRWLVRLVTPIGGTVVDPFLGSGTTGIACVCELRPFIGIERDPSYIAIGKRRIGEAAPLFAADAGA